MIKRRFFLGLFVSFAITACGPSRSSAPSQIVIGVITYGEGAASIQRYEPFKTYLTQSFKSIIQLEPALNEVQAMQQITQKEWDIVVAPPGLAAVAISQAQYTPIFTRVGANQERSLIVVKKDSPISDIQDLASQTIALGNEGSATGYYLPIYNLYGMTLSQVRFAPTPAKLLEWVDSGEVAAGALSIAELEAFQSKFPEGFRVLYRDTHPVPAGAILVSPNMNEDFKGDLMKALEKSPLDVLETVGFVPNAPAPDYDYLIKVVKRVRPIAQRIKETPAPLY